MTSGKVKMVPFSFENYPTWALLASNLLAATQPAVIKSITLSHIDQTIIRFVVFSILAILFTLKRKDSSLAWIPASFHPYYIALSMVNLISVFAGIAGFARLPVGVGLTTFYIWPLFLSLFADWNERIQNIQDRKRLWLGLFLSFLGIFFLFSKNWSHWFRHHGEWSPILQGFLWILVSAFTHAAIIWYHRQFKYPEVETAEERLGAIFFPGTLVLLAGAIFAPNLIPRTLLLSDSLKQVSLLTLYQATVGFVGFWLHFGGIPHVPAEWTSALGFTTLLFGYLLGWLFFREGFSWMNGLGTVLILAGIGMVNRSLKYEKYIKTDKKD